MQDVTNEQWAYAIAERISDEWTLKDDFPEDAELMHSVLTELLSKSPELCNKLIGTGIIEEDYFEELL